MQTSRSVEVRPVAVYNEPVQPHIIDVEASVQPVQVIFRSSSNPVLVQQIHTPSQLGKVEQTVSEDEPHRVQHQVTRPVIQEVREIIQPYRKVLQEIRPVLEEVRTIVAKQSGGQAEGTGQGNGNNNGGGSSIRLGGPNDQELGGGGSGSGGYGSNGGGNGDLQSLLQQAQQQQQSLGSDLGGGAGQYSAAASSQQEELVRQQQQQADQQQQAQGEPRGLTYSDSNRSERRATPQGPISSPAVYGRQLRASGRRGVSVGAGGSRRLVAPVARYSSNLNNRHKIFARRFL